MTLLDAALDLATHGCSVVPVAADGTKRPAIPWKPLQATPAAADQVQGWFTTDAYDGLGVVTGAVSGNLELLELEGRAIDEGLLPQLAALLSDSGLGDLWGRLCAGYLERSPSGGIHFLYRVEGGAVAGNTKLARRPNADNDRLVDVLIETRGEGGYVVVAPSGGRTHASGGAWTMLAGGAATIPTITADERDALHIACSTFDQMPVVEHQPAPAAASASTGSGLRPGDDYNARATWDDILVPHGWTRTKKIGRGYGWVRPGKNPHEGISATTGTSTDGVDRLYVFTTSTEFEAETPYGKFSAYALLEHHGDHSAAAKALRAVGYGDQTPPGSNVLSLVPESPPAPATGIPAGPGDAVQGAVVHQLQPRPTQTVGDSEDAHAERLIAAYGDLIRYCPQRTAWLVWSGARWVWQPKGGGDVREYAKNVARLLTDADASLAQRRKALSSAGITGCLRQAETDPRITVDLGQLDANPWILNTPAGVVDLRTGQLHDPDPSNLCTKTTTVAPAEAPDPVWDAFLADTFGADHALRDYVQRLVGLTLVGQVREQLLAFLHGLGANGKSTLAETLMHALGVGETGYAIAAPSEMLMIRKHSEHPAELAQLAGARMVVCSELDDGQRFAEARIKQLTGRDSVNARFLYGQPFTFQPTHTIWLLGNHRPQARTGGMAFWRRVKLIEFAHVVPPEKRDPALPDKLNAAAGAVLSWALAGAVDYIASGIREPAVVAEATAAYAADQDTVGRFVADCCHRADTAMVQVGAAQLRAAYEAWCHEVGEEAASAKRLGQELRDRFGVVEKRSNGKRYYTRISLLEVDRDEPESSAGSDTVDPDGLWS